MASASSEAMKKGCRAMEASSCDVREVLGDEDVVGDRWRDVADDKLTTTTVPSESGRFPGLIATGCRIGARITMAAGVSRPDPIKRNRMLTIAER